LINPSSVDSKPVLPLELQAGAAVVGAGRVCVEEAAVVGEAVAEGGASVPSPKVAVGGAGEAVHDGNDVTLGGAIVRVRVAVRLGVRDGATVRVLVEVAATKKVRVDVAVAEAVAVSVAVAVAVGVGVSVAVAVGVDVGVGVREAVGVLVGGSGRNAVEVGAATGEEVAVEEVVTDG
jgi:hypothetical protein